MSTRSQWQFTPSPPHSNLYQPSSRFRARTPPPLGATNTQREWARSPERQRAREAEREREREERKPLPPRDYASQLRAAEARQREQESQLRQHVIHDPAAARHRSESPSAASVATSSPGAAQASTATAASHTEALSSLLSALRAEKARNVALQRENDDLKAGESERIHTIEKENREVLTANQSLLDELRSCTEHLERIREERDALSDKNAKLREERDELTDKAARYRQRALEYRDRARSAEMELVEVTDRAEERVKQSAADLTRLKQQAEERRKGVLKMFDSLRGQFVEVLNNWSEHIGSLAQSEQEKIAQLEAMKGKLAEHVDQIARVKDDLNRMHASPTEKKEWDETDRVLQQAHARLNLQVDASHARSAAAAAAAHSNRDGSTTDRPTARSHTTMTPDDDLFTSSPDSPRARVRSVLKQAEREARREAPRECVCQGCQYHQPTAAAASSSRRDHAAPSSTAAAAASTSHDQQYMYSAVRPLPRSNSRDRPCTNRHANSTTSAAQQAELRRSRARSIERIRLVRSRSRGRGRSRSASGRAAGEASRSASAGRVRFCGDVTAGAATRGRSRSRGGSATSRPASSSRGRSATRSPAPAPASYPEFLTRSQYFHTRSSAQKLHGAPADCDSTASSAARLPSSFPDRPCSGARRPVYAAPRDFLHYGEDRPMSGSPELGRDWTHGGHAGHSTVSGGSTVRPVYSYASTGDLLASPLSSSLKKPSSESWRITGLAPPEKRTLVGKGELKQKDPPTPPQKSDKAVYAKIATIKTAGIRTKM